MAESDWRIGGFRTRRPSPDTLDWAAAAMGRGARVVHCRRMTGGVSSALDAMQVPAGAHRPGVWRAAFDALAAPPPATDTAFLHGDFLPVNVLWSRGKISGVTDWNGIHRGPRAVDVGHCRRYLAALISPDWAERLHSLYESIAGVQIDPWWDLYALLHHDDGQASWIRRQVAGRRAVDAPGMTPRVEAVVEATLERLG